MDIKIYGGNKIGGCITQISSQNTKIIFDYGNNLDNTKQIDIEGLTFGKPQYKAVFISHYHIDHIGAVNNIIDEIPIYVEKTTKKLYDVMCDFSNKPKIKAKTFVFEEDIDCKDFIVTPYRVDHSAYNSSMFLIRDKNTGELALYTGDYRDNGYSGYTLNSTLKKIGKIDYLITEGTNIKNNSHILKKEKSLVNEFSEICKKYNQVFVLMSASNIDRIVTILKACNKTKHIFIQDIYMAHLTSLIKKEDKTNIPNPVTFENVMVYVPKYFKDKSQEFKDKYLKSFIEKNKRFLLYKPFVMNIRTSMLKDLEAFKFEDNILTNSCLIYSMWGGYKEKEETKNFIKKAQSLGIDTIEKDIHTTGHASEEVIKMVEQITKPKKVYVIHTQTKN